MTLGRKTDLGTLACCLVLPNSKAQGPQGHLLHTRLDMQCAQEPAAVEAKGLKLLLKQALIVSVPTMSSLTPLSMNKLGSPLPCS